MTYIAQIFTGYALATEVDSSHFSRPSTSKYGMNRQLLLVCVLADAANIHNARVLSAKFLNSESPNNKDRAEEMLQKPLSPTGAAPATAYVCTRHMRQDEIERGRIHFGQRQLRHRHRG